MVAAVMSSCRGALRSDWLGRTPCASEARSRNNSFVLFFLVVPNLKCSAFDLRLYRSRVLKSLTLKYLP